MQLRRFVTGLNLVGQTVFVFNNVRKVWTNNNNNNNNIFFIIGRITKEDDEVIWIMMASHKHRTHLSSCLSSQVLLCLHVQLTTPKQCWAWIQALKSALVRVCVCLYVGIWVSMNMSKAHMLMISSNIFVASSCCFLSVYKQAAHI